MEKSASTSEIPAPVAPRRRNYRPQILAVIIILGLAGIVTGFFVLRKDKTTRDEPETTATDRADNDSESEPSDPESTKSEKTDPSSEDAETDSNPDSDPKTETEVVEGKTPTSQDGDASAEGELTGVINYAEVEDDTAMIRVSIDQYLETGVCLLEMVSPSTGDTFSLPDTITPSAATSTCSYDIATSLLTEGKYNISITLTSGDKKGLIKGEIDV